MKINEKLRSYFAIKRSKKILKKNVSEFSCYLKPGNYLVLKQYNCIYHDNTHQNNIDAIKGYFNKNIVGKKILISGSNNSSYSCMVVCGGGTSFKFFDFENKVVLTAYKSLETLEKYLESRTSIFPTSTIIDVDRESFLIKEALLVDCAKSEEEKFRKLIVFENEHASKSKISTFNISVLENLKKCRKSVIDRFNKYFLKNSFETSSVPSLIQHGDAWSANIFVEHNSLKFIDFDRVAEYPAFYDLFLFAYTEGFFKKDNSIVKAWLNGSYDVLFKQNIILKATNYKDIFVFDCYVMLLMRHESKGEYRISDEIIEYLEKIVVDF